ncbi:MAG: M15 family metallopeptidase [Clostridia bacterium]|nr:M15 family metallopeptidase [Clostridia bacterium]
MIEMNKNTSPDKKSLKARESNAAKFLCVVLALITVFVSIVCVAVHSNNKKLIAAQTSAAGGDTVPSAKPVDATQNNNSVKPVEKTTEPVSVTETQPPVTHNTAQPGTIENPTIITIDEENWHLTLVNSGYRIPDTYSPDLVYVCGSGERLDRKVAEHYEEMYNAALKDGVTLTPCSGYRSYETQERNYNRKIEFYQGQGYSYEEAKVKAATIIMPPGSSEHNLGYAMDIVCVDEWFEDTAEFKWLQENAADYGFIMRYPEDKQDITKVIYEPWHWRYVGVEAAKELKDSGLVLEEYLGVA